MGKIDESVNSGRLLEIASPALRDRNDEAGKIIYSCDQRSNPKR